MFEKLKDIETKYAEVENALGDPAQISNQQRLMELSKTHAELSPIVSAYQEYQQLEAALEDILLLIESETDAEMIGLAQEEIGQPHREKRGTDRRTQAAPHSERSER